VEKRFLIRGVLMLIGVLLLTSCDRGVPSISGTIENDEARVASRYGGRVEKIHSQEGDALKTGQVIVELNAAELQARRDRVAAQLSELEAGPRREEIEAAKAEWESQTAQLELARTDARRAEELFAQRTISATERDQMLTRAQSLEKNVAAAKSRHDLLRAGTRPEQIAQARAQLAEIEAQLSGDEDFRAVRLRP
jgi:HlyD family secretion protein